MISVNDESRQQVGLLGLEVVEGDGACVALAMQFGDRRQEILSRLTGCYRTPSFATRFFVKVRVEVVLSALPLGVGLCLFGLLPLPFANAR